MSQFDAGGKAGLILERLQGVRKQGDGWQAKCPAHEDSNPSLSVSTAEDGKVLLKCHANCTTEAVVAALGLEMADLFPVARKAVRGRRETLGRILTTYDYRDENGKLLYQVVRYDPKDFRQRRPAGETGWDWSLGKTRRVLYRLPELVKAPKEEPVLVVEGEKDADNLGLISLLATTNAGGAGKWRKEYNETLRGRTVCVLPDNDDAGRNHAADVLKKLKGVAGSVVVVQLPGLPPKGDVSDWLANGGTREKLLELAAPPSPRERETRETGETGPENNGDCVSDVPHVSPAAEPWDGDLGELLGRVEAFLARFIIYPNEHARVAHALWVAHAHAMDAWESTPRIAFLSPEPASGKSRALEVTDLLVPRPIQSVNTTPAALFRLVSSEEGRPTILFDEIDTLFGPKAKENEEIRGLLNAGHRRGAVAYRCVTSGKTVEVVPFPAYCALALAGLGFLPDTIMTRSVVVPMRRKGPNEKVEPFRIRDHTPQGRAVRKELSAWASRATEGLAALRPEMPAGVADRSADVWEPLLAVADMAGGKWPERAREAAKALVALSQTDEAASLGVRLLTDLKAVWEGDSEAMSSARLVELLLEREDSPWGDLKGKPLDKRKLASFLKKYGVKPTTVRPAGSASPLKGYRREDLHDPWERYVARPVGEEPAPDDAAADDEGDVF
jgi:hypothetical protein